MTWNGLETTNIYIGQHLRIESEKKVTPPKPKPKPQTTKKYYTVRSGDTFEKSYSRKAQNISKADCVN